MLQHGRHSQSGSRDTNTYPKAHCYCYAQTERYCYAQTERYCHATPYGYAYTRSNG